MARGGTHEHKMILTTNVYPVGGHMGGWRHPSAYPKTVMNLDAFLDIARIAEEGKFQSLFLADGNAVRQMENPRHFESPMPSDRAASFEPTTVMAAISQHTRHIGLFVTSTTTYDQPYLLARRLASLDHLSGGRTLWNVVTGAYPGDSVNFGDEALPDRAERYARSEEFLEVCKGLWESWEEDAFLQEKATGRFLDATKVRTLDHKGTYFAVKGPLNVARCPQGRPVLFMAGQSEPGREMAAKHVDCMYTAARTMENSIALYNDMKSRLAKYGRAPEELKLIPGMMVNVAETRREALELYAELNTYVSIDLGVMYLSAQVGFDLEPYDVDGPLPEELAEEAHGVTSFRSVIWEHARKQPRFTIRQAVEYKFRSEEIPPFTGSATEVVDELEEWFESGACDGFNILPPTAPLSLRRFVDLAVPELQRRGLFHEEYSGANLREELGLPVPSRSH